MCLLVTVPLSLNPVQVSQEMLQQIRETVLQKTVDGMREEGAPYVGECSLSTGVRWLPCICFYVCNEFLASDS